MNKKESREIALENEVLHAEESKFLLFYNSKYDLGQHLESVELLRPQIPAKQNGHFTLSKMNICTKNMTPPQTSSPKRKFFFINKGV